MISDAETEEIVSRIKIMEIQETNVPGLTLYKIQDLIYTMNCNQLASDPQMKNCESAFDVLDVETGIAPGLTSYGKRDTRSP